MVKKYMGFHINKNMQILKHFAAISLSITSYFQGMYFYRLPAVYRPFIGGILSKFTVYRR